MKLLFVLVGLILFCKGIEKGSNWLFFGGLILMMSFLMWQLFDNCFLFRCWRRRTRRQRELRCGKERRV